MGGILKTENVLLDLEAKSKEEVLLQMAGLLCKNGCLSDEKEFFREVLERERLGFTGAGNQLAIPHGISGQVKQVAVAVARLKEPVVWDTNQEGIAEDTKKVKLIVLFAVPEENPESGETYIEALKRVCSKLADKSIVEQLMGAEKSSQVADIFSDRGEKERSRKGYG